MLRASQHRHSEHRKVEESHTAIRRFLTFVRNDKNVCSRNGRKENATKARLLSPRQAKLKEHSLIKQRGSIMCVAKLHFFN